MKKKLLPKVKRSVEGIKASRIDRGPQVYECIDRNKRCIPIEHIATHMGHVSAETFSKHLPPSILDIDGYFSSEKISKDFRNMFSNDLINPFEPIREELL